MQLDATANVLGGFGYTPAGGTVLGTGPQTLNVIFTPTDSTDYTGSTGSVSLTVNQANAPIVLGSLNPIYDGTAKSATATTTPSGLPVTFTYGGSATPPTAVGAYTVVAGRQHRQLHRHPRPAALKSAKCDRHGRPRQLEPDL